MGRVVYKKWLTGVLTDSNFVADISTYNFLYNDIENARIYITSNQPPVELLPLDSAKIMIDLARYDSLTTLAFFSANFVLPQWSWWCRQ